MSEARPPEAGSDAPQRVLLAEDDAAVRALAARQLRRMGVDVRPACDGREALERFDAEGPFDAAVVDLWMPRLEGDVLIEALRRRAPALPVVLVSASPDEASVAADVVRLAKPYELDALLPALAEARRRARSASGLADR